jgi:hypothetical protein
MIIGLGFTGVGLICKERYETYEVSFKALAVDSSSELSLWNYMSCIRRVSLSL